MFPAASPVAQAAEGVVNGLTASPPETITTARCSGAENDRVADPDPDSDETSDADAGEAAAGPESAGADEHPASATNASAHRRAAGRRWPARVGRILIGGPSW